MKAMSVNKDLSEGGYEMLRAAMNAARQYECRSVSSLRLRLNTVYPGREADIDEAIAFWANDIAQRYPDGPPRH